MPSHEHHVVSTELNGINIVIIDIKRFSRSVLSCLTRCVHHISCWIYRAVKLPWMSPSALLTIAVASGDIQVSGGGWAAMSREIYMVNTTLLYFVL